MSELRPAGSPEPPKEIEAAATPASPPPPEPSPPEPATTVSPPAPAAQRMPSAVRWLAVLLGVVIAEIISAPFWAPALMPLLPWSDAAPRNDEAKLAALAGRLDRLDALPGRVDKVEALAPRLDRIEAARTQEQQANAASAAAVQQTDRRIAALEARPAAPVGDIAELRQQSAKQGATTTELASRFEALASRLDALEKSVRAQASADATDTGLTLILLQIRDALDTTRPFASEFDAFVTLARSRADISAAAAPLADAAKSGVASRAVLIRRLGELAGAIATAQAAPAEADWEFQALARLRSLVTIRRVAGAGQTASESTVNTAQLLLSQGDLGGAIGALDKLGGANAEAALPWLEMARTRLAAETALRKTEALLAARLSAAREASQSTARP